MSAVNTPGVGGTAAPGVTLNASTYPGGANQVSSALAARVLWRIATQRR